MKTSIRVAVVGYFEWHADEEEQDAEFLEECAHRFEAVREPFLGNAKIHRERAQNFRVGLEALREISPT
jgi:hypothetical protein